jgi:hypothetical protein
VYSVSATRQVAVENLKKSPDIRIKNTRNNISRKITSILTVLVFLFDAFLFHPISVFGQAQAVPAGTAPKKSFSFPDHLGEIKESWDAPLAALPPGAAPRKIIHIQDAHCNYDCQKRVAEIISYMAKEHGVTAVNLEGGRGEYDISVFDNVMDPAARIRVSDHLMREGYLSGAEYLSVNSPGELELWGVEDVGLYLKNLDVYRASLSDPEKTQKAIDLLDRGINILKEKLYSPELLDLDLKTRAYVKGALGFKEYLEYLVKSALAKSLPTESFPGVSLFKKAMQEEEGIDFKKANSDRNTLVQELGKRFSKKENEELTLKMLAFSADRISQKVFYEYLTGKAAALRVDMDAYPDLERYMRYLCSFESIDKDSIHGEISGLEDALKSRMFRSDNERKLSLFSRNVAVIRDIFAVKLTQDEYAYYLGNASSFGAAGMVSFINDLSASLGLAIGLTDDILSLDKELSSMVGFYRYSFERDDEFIRNMKFSENLGTAILVTGGFHSENLYKLFRANNISYVSIVPSFKNPEGYVAPYYDILSGKKDAMLSVLGTGASSLAVFSHLCGDASLLVNGRAVEEGWRRLVGMTSAVVGDAEAGSDAVLREQLPLPAALLPPGAAHMESLPLKNAQPMKWKGEDVNERNIRGINDQLKDSANSVYLGEMNGKKVWVDNDIISGYADFGFSSMPTFQQFLSEFLSGQFTRSPPLAGEIFIALLDSSTHLFEDHRRNGFIGINRAIYSRSIGKATRNDLLLIGLRHELMHEAGAVNETRLLEEDVDYALSISFAPEKFLSLRDILDADAPFVKALFAKIDSRKALEKNIFVDRMESAEASEKDRDIKGLYSRCLEFIRRDPAEFEKVLSIIAGEKVSIGDLRGIEKPSFVARGSNKVVYRMGFVKDTGEVLEVVVALKRELGKGRIQQNEIEDLKYFSTAKLRRLHLVPRFGMSSSAGQDDFMYFEEFVEGATARKTFEKAPKDPGTVKNIVKTLVSIGVLSANDFPKDMNEDNFIVKKDGNVVMVDIGNKRFSVKKSFDEGNYFGMVEFLFLIYLHYGEYGEDDSITESIFETLEELGGFVKEQGIRSIRGKRDFSALSEDIKKMLEAARDHLTRMTGKEKENLIKEAYGRAYFIRHNIPESEHMKVVDARLDMMGKALDKSLAKRQSTSETERIIRNAVAAAQKLPAADIAGVVEALKKDLPMGLSKAGADTEARASFLLKLLADLRNNGEAREKTKVLVEQAIRYVVGAEAMATARPGQLNIVCQFVPGIDQYAESQGYDRTVTRAMRKKGYGVIDAENIVKHYDRKTPVIDTLKASIGEMEKFREDAKAPENAKGLIEVPSSMLAMGGVKDLLSALMRERPWIKVQVIEDGEDYPDVVTKFELGVKLLDFSRAQEKDAWAAPDRELLDLIAVMTGGQVDLKGIEHRLFKLDFILPIKKIDLGAIRQTGIAVRMVETSL